MSNNYSKLPQSLKESGYFCLWSYCSRDGKRTKVPYSPVTGSMAKSNDVSTFGSFEQAVTALESNQGYSGIGIGIFDDLVGIDIDHCIAVDGTLSDLAADVLTLMGSYAEKSPSGEGIHILLRAPGFVYDKQRYFIKNSKIGLEVYSAGDTNRYLTVTGDRLNDEGANECTAELIEVLEKYMVRPNYIASPGESTMETNEDDLDRFMNSSSDDAVLQRMFQSASGAKIEKLWQGEIEVYKSPSEADLALCNHLAFWCRKDEEQMDRLFRQSGLYRNKWNEPRGNDTYGANTIKKAILNTHAVWTPGYHPCETTSGIESALDFLKSNDMVHNTRYPMNDIGAGYLLADFIKPFARPTSDGKLWFAYNGVVWSSKGGMCVVEESAKDMWRALQRYATELSEAEMDRVHNWADKWSQRNKRTQYIREAQTVHPVSREDFDCHPMLLNLNNGTLDLDSLELKGHDPDDLLTQVTSVDYIPGARCELFEAFVREIMAPGEKELPSESDDIEKEKEEIGRSKAEFAQRFFGYCLTGMTNEESFLVGYGPTSRNGKSTLIEAVSSVLGNYACPVNAETLLQPRNGRDGSRPSEDIAGLAGMRLVSVSEIPQGSQMDSQRIKQLTGGDTIKARFLNENSFVFRPQFKIFMHTNHLPRCADMTVFESGRVIVLPFSRHFEEHEQNKNLKRIFSVCSITDKSHKGIFHLV